jgi:hypothetical protein
MFVVKRTLAVVGVIAVAEIAESTGAAFVGVAKL